MSRPPKKYGRGCKPGAGSSRICTMPARELASEADGGGTARLPGAAHGFDELPTIQNARISNGSKSRRCRKVLPARRTRLQLSAESEASKPAHMVDRWCGSLAKPWPATASSARLKKSWLWNRMKATVVPSTFIFVCISGWVCAGMPEVPTLATRGDQLCNPRTGVIAAQQLQRIHRRTVKKRRVALCAVASGAINCLTRKASPWRIPWCCVERFP